MSRAPGICALFLIPLTIFAADTVYIDVGDDLQDSVLAYPEATVFIVKAGKHFVDEPVMPKSGQKIIGELDNDDRLAAILTGAIELKEWRKEGNNWVHENVGHSFSTGAGYYGSCLKGYKMCGVPEDLYADDFFLRKCESRAQYDTLTLEDKVLNIIKEFVPNIQYGTWFHDTATGTAYMKDDPSRFKMEASQTIRCIGVYNVGPWGTDTFAHHVEFKNLIVEKFATHMQVGAVNAGNMRDKDSSSNEPTGWLVENIEARWNHAHGITVQGMRGTIMRNCYIHHNGEMGFKVHSARNAVIEGNHIQRNGFRSLNGIIVGEEGGSKFGRTNGAHVIGNFFEHNGGSNLWFDGFNHEILAEGNLTKGGSEGIFVEISAYGRAGEVRHNVVHNGGNCNWGYGAGILVSHSPRCDVHHNLVMKGHQNGDGIAVIYQPEDDFGGGSRGPMAPVFTKVHHNDVVFAAYSGYGGCYKNGMWLATWGNVNKTYPDTLKAKWYEAHRTFMDTGGVEFHNNKYHIASGDNLKHWIWPPDTADGELGNDIRFGMIQYDKNAFGDLQARGVENGSTIDNDIDTSQARIKSTMNSWADIKPEAREWLLYWLGEAGKPNGVIRHPLRGQARSATPRITIGARTISIKLAAAGKPVTVRIVDLMGRILYSSAINEPEGKTVSIARKRFISSVNVLQVKAGSAVFTRKIAGVR
jgi:hypothetical protein